MFLVGNWPAGDNFYASAQWLKFVDSDDMATGYYSDGLIAHWSPHENNPLYQPGLIFGGRRGYHSHVPSGIDLEVHMRRASGILEADFNKWTWPFLEASDARLLRDELDASISLAGAESFVEVVGDSIDDFISQLPTRQRRTNFRRERRAVAESGLVVEVREGVSAFAEVERLGVLLSQVQNKYGHEHSPQLMHNLLLRQREFLGAQAVCFLVRDQAGEILAFNLSYLYADVLWTRVAGFDYAALRSIPVYSELMFAQPIIWAQANSCASIELGLESFSAKARRGAKVRPLFTVSRGSVAHPQTSVEEIIQVLPAREVAEFCAQTEVL